MDNTFSEKTVWEDDDDLVCEYDSTWEETDTDSDEENSTRKYWGGKHTAKKKRGYSWRRNLWAAEDMQVYRHGYPKKYEPSDQNSQSDMDLKMVNLLFYRNVIPSSPDDVYIDQFHTHWKGDYERLERVHSYIQWLFPLQEAGMNDCALELTKKEIKAFCEDEEAKQRLVTSYELMLDFYGIELIDKVTGEVKRSEKWMARFKNLNRNTHNNLRITRILKCLGELGFQHYQAPLVHFFLTETLMLNNLGHVKQSVLDYFLFTVRDKKKRRELIKYAFRHYNPKDVFLWCPRKIQVTLLEEAEKKLDDPAPEEIGLRDEHNGSTSVGPALKELVTPESSQDEGTEAMIESSRVPSESQPNGQGVEKNGTTDDTPTLEQESTLEKQNEEEKEQMAGEPSNSLAGVIPHPPERAMVGLSVSSNPAQCDEGVTDTRDPWLSKSSESQIAAGGLEESHSYTGKDAECHKFKGGVAQSHSLTCKGAENHGFACAESNNIPKGGVNDSPRPQAEGVVCHKPEGGTVNSSELEGGAEKSHSLEGAADIHKPKSETTDSDRAEGQMSKTHRPEPEGEESHRAEGGADKSHRPKREATNSGPENGADVNQSPEDEVKDKAVHCDSGHRQQLLSNQCEVVTGGLMEEAADMRDQSKSENSDDVMPSEEAMI